MLMELTLQPQAARVGTETNRECAEILESLHSRLQSRLGTGEGSGAFHGQLSGPLREACASAVDMALHQYHLVPGVWSFVRPRFEEGVEGGHGRDLVNGFLGLLARWLSLARAAEKLLSLADQMGATGDDRQRLLAAVGEATQLQRKAEKLLAVLDEPMPPVDEDRLRAGVRDIAEGRFTRLD